MRRQQIRHQHRKSKKLKKTSLYLLCAAALVFAGWSVGKNKTSNNVVFAATPTNTNSLLSQLNTEKVMIIGGSMAHGWKDPNDDSYLKRAFASLTSTTNTNWVYDDRTKTGASPVDLVAKGEVQSWIKQDKPQVVVISWGLLNDVSDKTPVAKFNAAIKSEIQASLAAHAVVVMVTSPVTKDTVLTDHDQIQTYIHNEVADAESFKSSNIHFIDLNATMTTYMQAHHQTWQMYYGDAWHPNQAGHELAGQLLFNQWTQTFGTGPVEFKNS
jgi:lysophospholipase L1-like esterase